MARALYEELRQHLGARPPKQYVDITPEGNVVKLYKADTDRLLQVICQADGTFHLDERSSGVQRAVTYTMPRTYKTHTPISEADMINKVLTWIE